MCGDADILITPTKRSKDELKQIQGILPSLVSELTKRKFMVERLGADKVAKTGSQTFMGVCKLKGGKSRRIDLKVYP